ncbi:transcriptional repressor NrdR [Heliorestis acidaminivorans]|uniref:Transcriptional repressor NrdR n=1 Tax=Heliorestis acidaminivorans TaxID=553427 RepID=A0A6I0EUR5_9FIRM|nr:transcriptional regulator NrdR [Heliorestis acidaminivorans]KAB2954515.1 transcriptional repressor NrdR [Heliorestis acidaminivorans]
MNCLYCGHSETKVIDTRTVEDGRAIRRRRDCVECNRRYTTLEKVEETPLLVRKKDGSLEIFDREKLSRGLLKACEKRPVAMEEIEALVFSIERDLRNQYSREVTAQQIGEMVMEKLRYVDEVAYVRFASVYRQFKDINRFLEELENLLPKQK